MVNRETPMEPYLLQLHPLSCSGVESKEQTPLAQRLMRKR
jgi:hypothetical protein